MADFSEILGKVGELSDEELSNHRQSALDEFNELKDADSTEENVNRMTEIADFVSTLKDEVAARDARTAELAAQADDAASRIAELTDSTEEEKDEVEEEDPVEEVKEDEEKKEDSEFAAKAPEDEDKKEEPKAEDESEDEDDKEKDNKPFSEDSEEDAELASKDDEKAKEEDSEDKVEDKADADAEAKEENKKKDDEEDHLFSENTEENNVATTPEELSVHEAPESKSAGLAVTITAGADIPGYGLGAELSDLSEVSKAFSERLRAIGSRGSGSGEQHTVASFNIDYPDDRKLVGGDRIINENRMNSVASPEAVTATGGICAPLPIDEELITYGSTNRPVRDSLPRFNAERGGVIYLTPPTLADVTGAVSVWTLADDYAAIGAELPAGDADKAVDLTIPSTEGQRGDGTALGTSVYSGAISGADAGDVDGPVKPCIRISCGDEIRAYVDAIPSCFTIGNMQARAYPELIEKHLELAMVWQARFGEQRLLTRMGNLSTKVSTKASHGITRDFLNGLSTAVAGFRSRHRLDTDFKLRVILPVWFRDAIRADMLLQIAGDGQDATFGLTDATIDRWISERGVNVTWALDGEAGQIFDSEYSTGSPDLTGSSLTPGTSETLEEFPDEVVWYLFPEGGFVFLDGGTLDLGIVRDSTLNSKNDYQIFVETFEGLIKRAPESFRVTTPLNIVGATTGTVDPVLGS